jgi:hypothetical protein
MPNLIAADTVSMDPMMLILVRFVSGAARAAQIFAMRSHHGVQE